MKHDNPEAGCGCGCNRRDFLAAVGTASGAMAFTGLETYAAGGEAPPRGLKKGAVVRAAFLYPPSSTFSENPDGWWSWPGNEFDAEGRQKTYTDALRKMERNLGMKMVIEPVPISNSEDAGRFIQRIQSDPPDGILLIMFYNRSLPLADTILARAEDAEIPAVFFIGLGVKHGSVRDYQRPGLYFIQSLDNLEAIEYGMRMINAKKRMSQTRMLSITEAEKPREGIEKFFGITVRVIPFAQFAEAFHKVSLDDRARGFMELFQRNASEIRGVSSEAIDNASRTHAALKKLLAEEQADGLTMNCLRRGMLKPCMSFSRLNSDLIPAACENDLPAMYTQLLGQELTDRPGFQHNPCFDTERNHYYASHCTCATKLNGPAGDEQPYLLRRFAHTNEGSCAIQVFWTKGEQVTMVRYHQGETPKLDVYAGEVVASHPMPPAAGCTTNVEVKLLDRADACSVFGHHNLIFCGDFARKFRLFAGLYRMELMAHLPPVVPGIGDRPSNG